jgi:protein TonB
MSKDPSLAAALPRADGPTLSASNSSAEANVFGTTVGTNPSERLFAPATSGTAAARRRFIAALVFCLFLHAGALFLLLHRFSFAPTPAEQEIPVEVVIVPPPPKQPDPPTPKEKPPEIQNTLNEKPAMDAPRKPTEEKIDREAKEDVSHAPKAEPNSGQTSAASPTDNPPNTASAPQPTPETTAKSSVKPPVNNNPDAEPIESAESKPAPAAENKPPTEAKKQAGNEAKSMAQLFANFPALPDYKIGSAARPSPVSGGNAENTYLSVLWGMIMPHMVVPPRLRSSNVRAEGRIDFHLDGGGNLTYQAIAHSSGFDDLDAAALAAIRQAAPFPMTPNGLPVALTFSYTSK